MGEYPTLKAAALTFGAGFVSNVLSGFRYRGIRSNADKAVVLGGEDPAHLISAISKIDANQQQTLVEACSERKVPSSKILTALNNAATRLTAQAPSAKKRIAQIAKISRQTGSKTLMIS